MRLTGRRILWSIGTVALLAAIWVPTLIAERYADGPGGADVGLARVDRGWEFIYQAIRLSRGAQLGHEDAALERARDVWAGPPAVARSVRLTYFDGAFEVPVERGGTAPPASRRVAKPPSRLGWVVLGRVRGGPQQMIGLLDYRSGRVAWDIRRPLPGAPS